MFFENDSITYPAAEIKYFAIDKTYQHKSYDDDFKFSDLMLCEVLKKLIEISEEAISFDYILLYSVPEAVNFYKRNGFCEFTEFMFLITWRKKNSLPRENKPCRWQIYMKMTY